MENKWPELGTVVDRHDERMMVAGFIPYKDGEYVTMKVVLVPYPIGYIDAESTILSDPGDLTVVGGGYHNDYSDIRENYLKKMSDVLSHVTAEKLVKAVDEEEADE